MGDRPRILVIDDDTDFLASISTVLEAAHYQIATARSAQEGLAALKADRPDLIILDVMMEHEWAGYELNQAVKFGADESVSSIPILMVSSIQTDPATLFSRATEVGMVTPDSYLTKPLDIPVFLARVKSFVGK